MSFYQAQKNVFCITGEVKYLFCCYNKLKSTWWVKTIQISYFIVLEVRCQKWVSRAKSVCWQAWIFGAPGIIHFPSFLAYRGCPHSLAHGSPPHPKLVMNSCVFPVMLCLDPVIIISSFSFKDPHDYTGTTQVVQNNLCLMISILSSSLPCNIHRFQRSRCEHFEGPSLCLQ